MTGFDSCSWSCFRSERRKRRRRDFLGLTNRLAAKLLQTWMCACKREAEETATHGSRVCVEPRLRQTSSWQHRVVEDSLCAVGCEADIGRERAQRRVFACCGREV